MCQPLIAEFWNGWGKGNKHLPRAWSVLGIELNKTYVLSRLRAPGCRHCLSRVKKGPLIWAGHPWGGGSAGMGAQCWPCAYNPTASVSRKWVHPDSLRGSLVSLCWQGPRSLYPHLALLYLCDRHRARSCLCVLICRISMFPPQKQSPSLKMQNLPIYTSGGGFPLSKKMLCKSIKLPVTEGTTEQGRTVRMLPWGRGRGGKGEPRGNRAWYYTVGFRARGLGDGEEVKGHPSWPTDT